jgi:two-component system, OmpR family, heavy metal sensor histidine kinase CusS
VIASLRTRLLIGTIVGTLTVLSLTWGGLYTSLRRLLQDDFNSTMLAKARAIAGMVEQHRGKVDLELDYRTMREFEPGGRCEYFELRRADGTILYRSHSLGSALLGATPGEEAVPAFRAVTLPDGRPGRLISLTFQPADSEEQEHPAAARGDSSLAPDRPAQSQPAIDPPITLGLARETRLLDRTLARLAGMLVGVGSGTMLLCAVAMSLVIRRGLRPLDQLAQQISAIDEDLAVRVSLPNAPLELGPVVHRLNDLLGRLEGAFDREKSFSADVAHELRTPLAGLRSTLEVSLSRPREAGGYRESLDDCLAIVRQMQEMIEKLLSLARMELGHCVIERQDVAVDHLLAECWKLLEAKASERGLEVDWKTPTPCGVVTDREQLRQVVYNLLDNAVTYADREGRISIETFAGSGPSGLRITNSAAGVRPEDLTHVFERFWRGEKARGGTGMHCGLGLALSRKIVALLGGEIAAECRDGCFAVTVLLEPPVDPKRCPSAGAAAVAKSAG